MKFTSTYFKFLKKKKNLLASRSQKQYQRPFFASFTSQIGELFSLVPNNTLLLLFPNLVFCLDELTIVCLCVCVCVHVHHNQWRSMCRVSKCETLNHMRLEPHRSGLCPDIEYTYLDRAHTYTHTHTYIYTVYVFISSLLICFISRTPHSTPFREGTPNTDIPGIFTKDQQLTHSGPCAVNIQGGMIFPCGWLFICMLLSVSITSTAPIHESKHSKPEVFGISSFPKDSYFCVCEWFCFLFIAAI